MRQRIRTCIGCRQREDRSHLIRVVAVVHNGVVIVRPDVRLRLPGRGAWVHPKRACVERAERRRAFGRALRRPGVLELAEVWAYLDDHGR